MLKIPEIPLAHPVFEKKEADHLFRDCFAVTLNGRPVRVRFCRESALPFNQPWQGYQRPGAQTEPAGFVNFSADEAVRVAVSGDFDGEKALVRPLARGIAPAAAGKGKVEFTLDTPGQYVLELGSSHQAIYFFYDAPAAAPDPRSVRWYFGPGIHFPGEIRLESGDSVYIDPAALVFGSLSGRGVRDIRIFGGGVLHGGMAARGFQSFYEDIQGSTVKFYNSSEIVISDVIVQDSPCWTTSFFGCSDVKIDHVKIVGQWRYNTDGIDLCNTDHVEIADSFVRSFDDTIVLKGVDHAGMTTVDWRPGRPVTDITVRNCVLWCGWGRTLELGIESAAPEYSRILFENCDLIHNSAVCLDIQNGNYADIHDVIFRDIRIEYQADTLPEVRQLSDDQVYRPGPYCQRPDMPFDETKTWIGVPKLIFIDNHKFGFPGKFGSTHDILFERIAVTAEAGVPAKLPVRIANLDAEAVCRDITLRDVSCNGRRLAGPGDVDYDTEGCVENVIWE